PLRTGDSQPLPLDAPVHSLPPGDFVLVRTWKDEPFQEKWKGPYLILLVSHTVAKVEGHKSWIHYSRLKGLYFPSHRQHLSASASQGWILKGTCIPIPSQCITSLSDLTY
uniref:Murine leukemia virus integrase C-terminal domain-containing protein n=1 Tax=Gopherus agassizii TaxID=38772 RepID=A0A452I4P0_9SAUR